MSLICICYEALGDISLKSVNFSKGDPDGSTFDCKFCNKKSDGIGTMGPYTNGKDTFIICWNDPHYEETESCASPINVNSNLLDVNCGCGHKERHSYRGDIYFYKTKGVDCTKTDIEILKNILHKESQPAYSTSCIIL